MINKILITALILTNCIVLQAQDGGKSKSSTKNYEKSATKRQGVELWNCSNINTPRTDFAPSFYQYGIVYASSEKNGVLDEKTGEPYFQLFYAETDRNHIPMTSRAYSLEANSQYHEGGVTFSKRGNAMYFSSNNQQNGLSVADKKGFTRMKIYEAERGLRDWENVKALDFNSDKFTCFHPSLSVDGRFLYFSSDMPGGFGGFDIYVAEKKGSTWNKPVNLGAKINGQEDEAFPFIHESGVLFFASKGNKSLGGFDIFKVDLNKTGTIPQNLGEPFNSNADDLALILNTDGDVGYLTSNREGGFGKDDIYMFKCEKRLTTETFLLNGLITVKDQTSSERLEGTAVRIFEKSSEGFLVGSQYYDVKMTPNADGVLAIEPVRKAAEQLSKPERITTSNGEAKYDFKNDREYLLLFSKEGYETKELIYNTFEKAHGLVFVDVVLNKMVKPRYKGTILSEKFNTAIPNATVNITNIATQKVEKVRTNANGEFEFSPDLNANYSIGIEKEGYKTSSEKVTIGAEVGKIQEKSFRLTPIEPEVVTKPISTGTVIVLEKIYYDFNKSIIRQGAAQELEALVNLMNQYKTMEVELVSHTDSRGNSDFNQRLADQRAISAKNYLTARGIAEQRIVARGAGESQLRNQCADGVPCSEEEHQYNRRTEVRIVKINETAVQVQYGDKGPEVINGKN
jgi:outer membrane protein OmpA-like peptidoglycan-associated protein